ncbi:MAG: hypothetical protein ACXWJF_04325 [Burkholderiaceae bacterium]
MRKTLYHSNCDLKYLPEAATNPISCRYQIAQAYLIALRDSLQAPETGLKIAFNLY